MDEIRIGKVSSINPDSGTVQITYPDRDRMVTSDFPVLKYGGEYWLPKIGETVLVAHLSNDASSGVALGAFWGDDEAPEEAEWYQKIAEGIKIRKTKDGLEIIAPEIRFSGSAGSMTLSEIVELEKRVERLEARI